LEFRPQGREILRQLLHRDLEGEESFALHGVLLRRPAETNAQGRAQKGLDPSLEVGVPGSPIPPGLPGEREPLRLQLRRRVAEEVQPGDGRVIAHTAEHGLLSRQRRSLGQLMVARRILVRHPVGRRVIARRVTAWHDVAGRLVAERIHREEARPRLFFERGRQVEVCHLLQLGDPVLPLQRLERRQGGEGGRRGQPRRERLHGFRRVIRLGRSPSRRPPGASQVVDRTWGRHHGQGSAASDRFGNRRGKGAGSGRPAVEPDLQVREPAHAHRNRRKHVVPALRSRFAAGRHLLLPGKGLCDPGQHIAPGFQEATAGLPGQRR